MDLAINGRVALVAGASSGLGRAVALALAAEGCAVSICGRDPERLAATAAALTRAGASDVRHQVVDVTDETSVAGWVADTAGQWGAVHIVVTNGGGARPGTVDDFTLDDYRAAAETVLLPHIGLALAALPHLRAAGWGRILLIASETARQPIPRYGLSSTLRPALLGFARSLVPSLGAGDITVNVLAPGYHDTPGLRRQFPTNADEQLARIAADIPVGRVGRVEDFGAAAAFLAGSAASFITGTCLLVDGGATRGIG
jgi:3-oxoacyl-[acyl-carrier protein] reductase